MPFPLELESSANVAQEIPHDHKTQKGTYTSTLFRSPNNELLLREVVPGYFGSFFGRSTIMYFR